MKIDIPNKVVKKESTIIVRKALKSKHNRKRVFKNKVINTQNCIFEGEAFYPYWIGQVYTRKERLYVKPKELYYHVVCDARDNTYVVLPRIPDTKTIERVDDDSILPISLKLNSFMNEIIKDAIKNNINKQFIFGQPFSKVEDCKIIYIPGFVIGILDSVNNEKEEYFINAFTGEAKKL